MGVEDQGIQISKDRYLVVPRTLIFVTHNGCVLLLKGSADKKIWPNRYNGLGGHVEAGETITAAARREVAEEAGITSLADITLCGTCMIETDDVNTGILLFVFSFSEHVLITTMGELIGGHSQLIHFISIGAGILVMMPLKHRVEGAVEKYFADKIVEV